MSKSKRRFGRSALALAAASALVLAACGQSENLDPEDPGTGDADQGDIDLSEDPVEIRVAWWGSEGRHTSTTEALAICEDKLPNISIEVEVGSQGGGYDDRLATQFAGGNPPDVFQVTSAHISSYAQRGGLLDLDLVSEYIDTDDIPEAALLADMIDGVRYNIPITMNATGVLLNTTLLDEYGLERPDDSAWTWEDLAQFAQEASEASDDNVWGLQQITRDINLLSIWARQLGHEDGLYNRDGSVNVSSEVPADFLQYALDRQEDGGVAPASITMETMRVPLEQTLTATNRAILSINPINEVVAISQSSGSDFELLQLPVHEQGSNGQTFRSMSWSIPAVTPHPAEAAQVLNCLQSDLEVADILLAERGIPANTVVLEHILPTLSDEQEMMGEFITEVEATAPSNAAVPPPTGADQAGQLLDTAVGEVLFGTSDPADAAEHFISELQSGIDSVN